MSAQVASRAPTNARGFTLVEIMIAMLLLMFVSAGIFGTLISISRAQAASARVDLAQGGVRSALELITRDVEMASAGARSGTIWIASGGSRPAIVLTDSTTGPDRVDLLLVDPTAQATLEAPFTNGQTSLTVDNITNFHVGDLIQLSDLVTAVQLQVTSLTVGATTSAIGVVLPAIALPATYGAGCYVFRSRAVSYYVDSTIFGAQNPLLMFDPDGPAGTQPGQPLAEGIEDLQLALGVDSNSDGLLSNVGSVAGDDEWIGNFAGESAPASLSLLRAVRVTLVARPTSALNGTRGQRPTAEDHPAALTSDAFPRRVLRSEVAVRNFNL